METIEITKVDFEEIKRILSNHCYTPEDMNDIKNNDDLLTDAIAYDHALILEILNKYE